MGTHDRFKQSDPFTEAVGSKADDITWEITFGGARKRMRCNNCPSRVFTLKGGTWVCKKCGSEVEHVSRVKEAIEQEQELQKLMDQIEFEDDDE